MRRRGHRVHMSGIRTNVGCAEAIVSKLVNEIADAGPLVDWVENGRAPSDLTVVEQQAALPITVDRSLPLCKWPAWPHYKAGDSSSAASFVCAQ